MPDASAPGLTGDRRAATVAMLLAMAVTALEMTVVSPAMPRIIASLRGFDIYPWVPSAYILASTVTVPLYGKLADRVGRKRVLLFGLTVFGLGSVLSGASVSMPMLIGMRVVQGLGAGAVAPIVLTLIGDLYTLEERAKVQGLFSGVWGICSVAGPALGGVLTDRLSWRWVFYVTIPFNLVATLILVRHVHERVRRPSLAGLDGIGTILVGLGASLVLLGALGSDRWSARTDALLVGSGLVLLLALFRWEQRHPDPILPVDLLRQPAIAAAIGCSFIIGALLFGMETYIPLYVQGVGAGSATDAGGAITPLFLSWSFSVAVAARVLVRLGFRGTATAGALFIAAGMVGLAVGSAHPESSRAYFLVSLILTGLGMGPAALSFLLSVQHVVPWNRRGASTGAVIFFRMIGGALGVGGLGAVLTHRLSTLLGDSPGFDPSEILLPHARDRIPAEALQHARHALGESLQIVFLAMAMLSVVSLILSRLLPAGRITDTPPDHAPGRPDETPAAELALEI